MTGVAGAFLMLGGMAAIAVIITTLDYLAGRRDDNLHRRGAHTNGHGRESSRHR
jgi:hypothetical protein